MRITPQNLASATDARLTDGDSPAAAVAWLQQNGVPEAQAREAVDKAVARRMVDGMRSQAMQRANRRLLFGVIIFVVGVAVTVGTYATADAGDSYAVLWGAMVVGVLAMGQGVLARARVQRAARKALDGLA